MGGGICSEKSNSQSLLKLSKRLLILLSLLLVVIPSYSAPPVVNVEIVANTGGMINEQTFSQHTDTGISWTGTDPDGDTVSYIFFSDTTNFSQESFGNGRKLHIVSGVTFDYETRRTYEVSVYAIAGSETTEAVVTVSVLNVDEPPTLVTSGITVSVFQGGTLSVAMSKFLQDPEGDSLSISSFSKPSWVSFNTTTQMFVLTPASNQDISSLQDVSFEGYDADFATNKVASSFKIDVEASSGAVTCSNCLTWTEADTLTTLNEQNHTALSSVTVYTKITLNIASAVSGNDAVTYEYAGDDREYFVPPNVASSKFDVIFQTGKNHDYETKRLFTISIVAKHKGIQIGQIGRDFTIANINEPPLLATLGSQVRIAGQTYNTAFTTGITISVFEADTGDTFTFSISNDKFTITTTNVTNALVVKSGSSFDYDTVAERSQVIKIQAEDNDTSSPGISPTLEFTINISPLNEAPVVALGGTTNTLLVEGTFDNITETGLSIEVSNRETTDTISFSVSDSKFQIDTADDNKLEIKAKSSFDHETAGTITITVTVSDVINQVEQAITITFADVDEAPSLSKTGRLASLNEGNFNTATDTGFTFTANDPEEASLTWTITGDNRFARASDGKLQIKANSSFNYGIVADRSITLTIAVNDGTHTVRETATINFNKVNDAPVITRSGGQGTLNEGSYTSNTNTGFRFTATDADADTVTFSVSDTTNFVIASTGGNLQIIANTSFDYESTSQRSHTLTITATDGTASVTNIVTINISDLNEAPSLTRVGSQALLDEGSFNVVTDTGFGFTATDPERGNITWTVSDNRFQVASNGRLQIKTNSSFNYRIVADRAITLTISASDGTHTVRETATINFNKVNDAPVISRSGSQSVLNEGTFTSNTNTGYSFTATDADNDSLSFSISDTNYFYLASSGGNLQIKANTSFDYENITQRSHTITITVSDGTATNTNIVTISISNIDEPPVIIKSGVSNLNESTQTAGYLQNTHTGIDIIVRDPDDIPVLTYSDNNFLIDRQTNRLVVKRGVVFDYENESHRLFTITITATTNRMSVSTTVTVSVNNVKEGVGLRNSVIATVEVSNNQVMNIDLEDFLIYDTYRAGISYQVLNPPSAWTNLQVNAGTRILSGLAPQIINSQSLSLTVVVQQDDTNLQTQNYSVRTRVDLVISIKLVRSNFADVEDVIIPNVFDAIISQSSGAVLSRIASMRNNGVTNPLGTEILTALKDNEEKLNRGEANLYQVLQDRNLALGFIGDGANNAGIGLWTRFGFNNLKASENQITYDGSVNGVSAGVDYQYVNGGIFGLAFSNNSGEFDFSQSDNNETITGVYELDLSIIQPYYSNDFGNEEFWMSLGLGKGELALIKASNDRTSSSDLQLIASNLGFKLNLLTMNEANLDLLSEFQLQHLNIKNTTERDYNKQNLKLGLSYSHDFDLSQDSAVIADYGLAIVNRTTKGITDTSSWGYEVFTNMEYSSNEIPLQISGDLSYVGISSIDLRQISGGLAVSYRNPATKLGSFIEIEPAYRNKDTIDINDLVGSDKQDINEAKLLLSSKLGYGFGVIGGVLTPYGDYSINHDTSNYGLGVRYNQADKLTWSLGLNTENDQKQKTKFGFEYKVIN